MILDRDGESAHFGLCGDEGAVGLSGLQGSSATTALGTSLVIVRSAAYRCATSAIERELEIEELRSLVIRYFRYVLSEAMLVAFCNKRHTLQQQMCRLLLMVTDRIASAEIRTTHQIIAALVGTRREAITDMAGRLRNDGVLAYTRGALRIIDRNALLEQTCDCYLRLQDRYTELAGQCAAAGTDAGAGRNVSISRCK
jgi:CRP-like cAMP-binding protein